MVFIQDDCMRTPIQCEFYWILMLSPLREALTLRKFLSNRTQKIIDEIEYLFSSRVLCAIYNKSLSVSEKKTARKARTTHEYTFTSAWRIDQTQMKIEEKRI